MTIVAHMPDEAGRRLSEMARFGFDKCLYIIEPLHADTVLPLAAYGWNCTEDHLAQFVERVPQDPLRRMIANGSVPLRSAPLLYENYGHGLSIAPGKRWSASEVDLLRWALAQGVRTGITFRIRMSGARYASVNLYSCRAAPGEREAKDAIGALFLLGHEIHELLELEAPRGGSRRLTRREIECLEAIANGLGNQQIAQRLGLSVETVKEHVASLFRKLDANGRAQAVSRAHALAYLG